MGLLLDGGVEVMCWQFEINVFVVVGVICVLFLLLRCKFGLVVNVGSVFGVLVMFFVGVYCVFKVVVYVLSDVLCLELVLFGVEVLEVQLGVIVLNFGVSVSCELDSVVDECLFWWLLCWQIQVCVVVFQDNFMFVEDFVCQLLVVVQCCLCLLLVCIGNGSWVLLVLVCWLLCGLLEWLLKKCFGFDMCF